MATLRGDPSTRLRGNGRSARHPLHIASVAWWALMAGAVALSDRVKLLEPKPGGARFEEVARPLLLGAFLLGGVLALRSATAAALAAVVAGSAVSVFAFGQLEPRSAFLIMTAFAVPAAVGATTALRSPRKMVVAAAFPAVLLVALAATIISSVHYDRLYGPTHPSSAAAELGASPLAWVWSGAVTEASATVVAKLDESYRAGDVDSARLVFSERSDLADASRRDPVSVDRDAIARFELHDLAPGTTYHYAVEVDGQLDLARQGTFRTFEAGAQSFRVVFGGDARVGSNGAVFDMIRDLDPALFVLVGDWYYGNVVDDDPSEFRALCDIALEEPGQAALFRSAPVAYMWDDHDYGSNNSDAESPSRGAAMSVYRQYVPHYPLEGETAPIHQAFTMGRIRFLMTDTRSARSPSSAPDDGTKSMLGAEQKAWLERELLAARDTAALTVWVNPTPWIEPPDGDVDTWSGYSTEREQLADFIATNRIRNLVMVSGDAHMVAIDDGTNSDYSSKGDAGFPVLHAAALDRRGKVKGGPYSEGVHPGGGQFGVLEVDDDGSQLDVHLSGRNWLGETLVAYEFTVSS